MIFICNLVMIAALIMNYSFCSKQQVKPTKNNTGFLGHLTEQVLFFAFVAHLVFQTL